MISVNDFFELFLAELAQNKNLWGSYHFLESHDPAVFNFRKRYFCQRMEYIQKVITKPGTVIWDCGCGFGTTAIFLTLNGHSVYGNTLEFYFDQVPDRIKYWSQFGDLDSLNLTHENLFDKTPSDKYDYIIAQDTLHHLEPIADALGIISASLKPDGSLIAIEENGSCLIQRFKNFLRRGNRLVIEIDDEKTNSKVLLGNENIRPLNQWEGLLAQKGMKMDRGSAEYIRLFLPVWYKVMTLSKIESTEKTLWKNNSLLRNYFYFGMNFTARKI